MTNENGEWLSSGGLTTAEIVASPEWRAFEEQRAQEIRELNRFHWSDLFRGILGVLLFLLFYASLPGSLILLVWVFEWLHWNALIAGGVWLVTLGYLQHRFPDFGSGT